MATPRSRNYPALSLGEAIEKAQILYKQEGRARAPATVIVSAWGYNSLNGASLRVLSAVRQYGLLEGNNEGSRLTDRALAILLEPEDSDAHAHALTEALSAPALFQEIMQEYGADLPSDAAIVSYLVRKQNFNEAAARTLIQSFRASIDLVRAKTAIYDSGSGHPETTVIAPVSDAPKPMYQGGLAQSHKDNRLDLNHGNIAASLLIRGGTIAQDDVELVASWLKFAESFMRAAAKPSVEPGAAPVGAADENEQI